MCLGVLVVNKQIARYFQNRPEIVAVYLFGSVAQGKVRSSSDVDIGIIVDEMNQDVLARVISGGSMRVGDHVSVLDGVPADPQASSGPI